VDGRLFLYFKDKNMLKQNRFLAILSMLFLAMLACSVNVGGPEIPDAPELENIEGSKEAMETQWKQAFEDAKDSGVVTITFTEAQLTAFLRARAAEDENVVLDDPIVILTDGQMDIYGTTTQGNVTANIRVSIVATVGDDGGPALEVTGADLGPVEVTEERLSAFTAAINEALSGQVGSTATGFKLEAILIQEDLLAVSGTVR
jgi:hypothetical protein